MVSKELFQILSDFIRDILTTFPECKTNLHPGLLAVHEKREESPAIDEVVEYCKTKYPELFFDILYQNEDIFKKEAYLLPGIDFSRLWKLEISDNTRNIIWKYLQLILFSTVKLHETGESFGETAKLFEAINEQEFKDKLEETIEQMTEIFSISGEDMSTDISGLELPDPEKLQDHISSMLEGNLGNLAREIAAETAEELTDNFEGVSTVGDVFKKLFRNPGKLMSLVKKVGNKLDSKLKSGEMKESELIREASQLMTKMNNMPGMSDMNKMLSQMGLPAQNRKNMGAFQAHMAQNMKMATARERMQRKLQERRAAAAVFAMQQQAVEAQQASQVAEAQQAAQAAQVNPKKKKKRRRKKRKNKK